MMTRGPISVGGALARVHGKQCGSTSIPYSVEPLARGDVERGEEGDASVAGTAVDPFEGERGEGGRESALVNARARVDT